MASELLERIRMDPLPFVVTIGQRTNMLSSQEYIAILADFMNKFDTKALVNLVFHGLQNTESDQKYEWIQFMHDRSNSLHQIQCKDDKKDVNEISLLSLHDDALTSICQFLTIKELCILEKCNAFLFEKIRSSPHCLVTLNYPQWLSYLNPCNKKIKIQRISNVKRVFLMNEFQGNRDPTKMLSQQLLANLTHLSIDHSDVSYQCSSLEHLTTFRMSFEKIFNQLLPKIGSDLHSLQSLNVNQCLVGSNKLSNQDIECLLNSKLKTLTIDVEDKLLLQQYRWGFNFGTVNEIWMGPDMEQLYDLLDKDQSLWHHLQHFSIDKGIKHASKTIERGSIISDLDGDAINVLCNGIIRNCRNLSTLRLINFNKSEYDELFPQKIKWNCNDLKDIALHISSSKMCEILQHLTDNEPELIKIDLLLWDHATDAQYRKNGSQILNRLRDLLMKQLTNSDRLRDITLTFETYLNESDWSISAVSLQKFHNNRLRLLYSMFIYVLNNEKCKYRKELNIDLTIKYSKEITESGIISCDWFLIEKLLKVLKDKIECFTLTINYHFMILSKDSFEQSGFGEFELWLKSKRDQFTTRIDEKISGTSLIRMYCITNISPFLQIQIDDIPNENEEPHPPSNEHHRYIHEENMESKVISDDESNSYVITSGSFDDYPKIVPVDMKIDFDPNNFFLPIMNTTKQQIPASCFICGKTENVMKCSQCKMAFYCSREHQLKDWIRHSTGCRAVGDDGFGWPHQGNQPPPVMDQPLMQRPQINVNTNTDYMNIDIGFGINRNNDNDISIGTVIELLWPPSNEWQTGTVTYIWGNGEYAINFPDDPFDEPLSYRLEGYEYRILTDNNNNNLCFEEDRFGEEYKDVDDVDYDEIVDDTFDNYPEIDVTNLPFGVIIMGIDDEEDDEIEFACFVCGKSRNLMRCSQCKSAFYCSTEHQIEDWERHETECQYHYKQRQLIPFNFQKMDIDTDNGNENKNDTEKQYDVNDLEVGTLIELLWPPTNKWQKGTITHNWGNGECSIAFQDDPFDEPLSYRLESYQYRVLNVHGNIDYAECHICGKRFINTSSLRKHLSLRHKTWDDYDDDEL